MKYGISNLGGCHKCFLSLFVCISLVACQSNWVVEPDFGSTVNDSILSQKINPKAPLGNPKSSTGLDGVAAKQSIDSYQKSLQTKPSTSNYPAGGSLAPSTGGTSSGVGVQ